MTHMSQEKSGIMQMFGQQQAMDQDSSQKSGFGSVPLPVAAGFQHRKPHLQDLFPMFRPVGKEAGGAQLTIFYRGMVNVYDDISADKAQALMLIASTGKHMQKNSSYTSEPQPTKSDLPIARKNSLQRFLEKRNHRVNAKAPYTITQEKPKPSHISG